MASPLADSVNASATPLVLLINPPNSFSRASADGIQTTYPHLGLLTLATATHQLADRRGVDLEVHYLDGTLHNSETLRLHIRRAGHRLRVLGLSAYTYNYGACLELAQYAKHVCNNVITVLGNDHFSAMPSTILRRQAGVIDCGFVGNDIVEGASQYFVDVIAGTVQADVQYAGLACIDSLNAVHIRPERESEYRRLPLVDYGLLDCAEQHSLLYCRNQVSVYRYMADAGFRGTVIDIGRGCVKFSGPRTEHGVPTDACTFCAIIPGAKAIATVDAPRAWTVIRNAYSAGYNYLFVTADELPETFWPMLAAMARNQPDWYRDVPYQDRPRLMCYARADAFRGGRGERIDVLMRDLRVDHFIIGFDGYSPESLVALNKPRNRPSATGEALAQNSFIALEEIERRGGRVTAGAVVTHLGITRNLMDKNFETLRAILERFGHVFAELDFELLAPIPGSLAFEHLRTPGAAITQAAALGLAVNPGALAMLHSKYYDADLLDPEEMVRDFILGCCPDISVPLAIEYLERIRDLVEAHGIPFECSSLGVGV